MGEDKPVLWADVGKFLRDLRAVRNQSVHRAAKQIHISGNYLSLLERGINAPSDEVLYSIADYYGLDHEELFAKYNRVTPEGKQLLKESKDLRKILTQLSMDDRITDEEKQLLSVQFYKLYEDLIRSKE